MGEVVGNVEIGCIVVVNCAVMCGQIRIIYSVAGKIKFIMKLESLSFRDRFGIL